jgi:hypothetical protein
LAEKRIHTTCPGCAKPLNLPWNAKLLKCSCGYSFSTRNGALYKNNKRIVIETPKPAGKQLSSDTPQIAPSREDPQVDQTPQPLPSQAEVWYYTKGNQQIGPISYEELTNRIQQGAVDRGASVHQKEWGRWERLESIGEFLALLPNTHSPSGIPRATPAVANSLIDNKRLKAFLEFSESNMIWLGILVLFIGYAFTYSQPVDEIPFTKEARYYRILQYLIIFGILILAEGIWQITEKNKYLIQNRVFKYFRFVCGIIFLFVGYKFRTIIALIKMEETAKLYSVFYTDYSFFPLTSFQFRCQEFLVISGCFILLKSAWWLFKKR